MRADDPRHGTYAGALAHYRSGVPTCEPCATAARRHTKLAKIRLDRGIRNRIPLGQAAWTILTNVGCTIMARETGLCRNNLYRAQRAGADTLVLRSTRDAILTARQPFTPIGIQRRLRALAAIGYTMQDVADVAEVHREPLTRIVRRDRPPLVVKTTFALGIAAAYDQLHMIPLNRPRYSTRQRATAARRGWAPPIAWDEGAIDDPNAKPELGADTFDFVTARKVNNPEAWEAARAGRMEDLEFLADSGVSTIEAARRVGMSVDALEKWLARAGRSDLYIRMAPRDHNAPTNASKYAA